MRLSDLQNKTVVNLIDGKNIGNIIDLNINDKGEATGLVVEKHKFLISYFSSKKEMVIKWEQIEKIGEDVILVKVVY
ncbi:MAG: YlmC/YmxH family sporulation protein [Bacilli bacterium]|nr:YlmC/YmxH family sporulation protein [Bacilli bacterium]